MLSIQKGLEMRAVIVDIIDGTQLTVHDYLVVDTDRTLVNVEDGRSQELHLLIDSLKLRIQFRKFRECKHLNFPIFASECDCILNEI